MTEMSAHARLMAARSAPIPQPPEVKLAPDAAALADEVAELKAMVAALLEQKGDA